MSVGLPQISGSISVQKALWILEVLKGLPAGDVIYKQVEQILTDLDHHHAQIERTYSSIIYGLLDAYLQHLNPGTPLYVQVKMMQRRVQPPLWEPDLETLKAQMEIYSDHIAQMQDLDSEEIGKLLSPLLQEQSTRKKPAENSISTEKAVEKEQETDSPDVPSYLHFYPRRRSDDKLQDQLGLSHFYQDPRSRKMDDFSQDLSREIQLAISKNEEFGVTLNVLATEIDECADEHDLATMRNELRSLIGHLNTSHNELVKNLEVARRRLANLENECEELGDELQRVRMLSLTDELTELPNRRAFIDRLQDEVGRVQRHKLPLSLAIIDLDDFKTVNDKHGHVVGDEVLKTYANDIFSLFRQYDMVARYGGEEFAILLPNTDKEGAMCALTKIRNRAQQLRCRYNDLTIPVPSFSAGLAIYHEGESPDTYIERADRAMYRAKSLGRNRVEMAIH